MDIPPDGGHGGGYGTSGVGDLRLLPPEHSRTIYFYQAHYGPESGGGAEARFKVEQAVVRPGRIVFGGDVDGGLGGVTDGGEGVDGKYRNGDRTSR